MSDASIDPHERLFQGIQKGQAMISEVGHRIEDIIALQRLPLFPKTSFLPWTGSALKPSTILTLLHEIELHQCNCIVELGSGISTLYLSHLLSGSDRRLISIDNDAEWQSVVRTQAGQLGVSLDRATFVHAPLKPYRDATHTGDWYDPAPIKAALLDTRIDCLLVDGPIAHPDKSPTARFPALPALRPFLNEQFVVYLDDCGRPGEQSIARDWSQTYHLDGLFLPERGNVCLLFPVGAKRFNVV